MPGPWPETRQLVLMLDSNFSRWSSRDLPSALREVETAVMALMKEATMAIFSSMFAVMDFPP